MRKLVLALGLAASVFFGGCSGIPIEVCYVHPTYGQVCVSIGGKEFKRSDLTPEQQAEVDKWLKEKAGK